MLTIGAEEEYFIVDPRSRALAPNGLAAIKQLKETSAVKGSFFGFDDEYQLPIVEGRTGVCTTLAELERDLSSLRRGLIAAAEAEGLAVAAAGTLPTADWRDVAVVDKPRYSRIGERYGDVVNRRLTCGYHVHVGIDDPDLAVQVMNRVQPWLPTLLAISASSPMFVGRDTGYASYRHTLWGGFPVAGPAPRFETYRQYTRHVELLIETGVLLDAGNVFWDVRPATRFPTLEFRIADINPHIGNALLHAALCRALVLTCGREVAAGKPEIDVDLSLLRAAAWHAARWGLSHTLLDVATHTVYPAAETVERLLHYVCDALEECDDLALVTVLIDKAENAALRQQEIYASTGSQAAVTDWVLASTKDC